MELNQSTPPTKASVSSHPALSEVMVSSGVTPDTRLSYKFQRLREKLRAAIDSGELAGKLPGERQLARRFRVNAKTLSKALTDLAAEGVLERSIGRGTFVKGPLPSSPAADATSAKPAATPATDRWLIICPADRADSPVIRALCAANQGVQLVHDTAALRPSFLNSFKAVIDFDPSTPAALLRDLVVRNMQVIVVGREPSSYSMNAVLLDRVFGANNLARDLMLAGHRRFLAVERRGSTQICEAIRRAAQRYAPDATVDVAFASEARDGVELGATAVICDSADAAVQVSNALAAINIAIPGRASLAAIDVIDGPAPCSGYFLTAPQKTEAIMRMLAEGNTHRPNTLWLTGSFIDAGTTGPTDTMIDSAAQSQRGSGATTALR